MSKVISYITAIFVSLFLTASFAMAESGSNLSVRLEQPKTPTNQNSLKLVFVALEINGTNPITVKCFKKGPSDSDYSQFGSDIVLDAPGNTSYCQTDSSILNTEGTYNFYVTANSLSSNTVVVDYKTTGPGTPTDYNKSKEDSCHYRIKFKTADDSGKTVKVVLYRSDQTSFGADAGHQVDDMSIGSNTNNSFLNTIPDCNKEYYYALRAFDAAGNGSSITGDSFTTTTYTGGTTSTTTSTAPTTGALLTDKSDVKQESVDSADKTDETISPTPTEVNVTPSVLGSETSQTPFYKHPLFILGVFVIALGIYIFFNKRK